MEILLIILLVIMSFFFAMVTLVNFIDYNSKDSNPNAFEGIIIFGMLTAIMITVSVLLITQSS